MLKKLKSLFIIEEGAAPQDAKPAPGNESEPKKEAVVNPGKVFKVEGGATGVGKVQDKFLEVLFGALEATNHEGFDYMEYKDFLRSLANVPMDDSTRIKSAFATAQTMGATKQKIINSAREYLKVLLTEEKKFQEALVGQKERNLTGKHNEIKQLEQTINNKEAEIEKLKKDLVAHRDQIGVLEKDINAASEKLAQTANDFEATYQALVSQIEGDVKNIELHL